MSLQFDHSQTGLFKRKSNRITRPQENKQNGTHRRRKHFGDRREYSGGNEPWVHYHPLQRSLCELHFWDAKPPISARWHDLSRIYFFFPEFLRYLYKFPHIFIRSLLLSLSHSLLLSLPFSRGTSSPPSNRAIGFSPLQNLSDRKLNLPPGRSVRLSRSHFRSTEADPLHVLSFVLLARWKRSPRCSAE